MGSNSKRFGMVRKRPNKKITFALILQRAQGDKTNYYE